MKVFLLIFLWLKGEGKKSGIDRSNRAKLFEGRVIDDAQD